MANLDSIVVVGGSLAGLRGAEALRRLGFEGRLSLVGAEPHRPYDRPPLSKDFLEGKREADDIALTKPESWDGLELDLHLGRRAIALATGDRQVTLDDDTTLGFDGCLIATGASPRSLPGTPDLPGIHVLRTLDDAVAIRSALDGSPRVAVVGAGFIGAEVAATCRGRGLEVTMIEALPTPLANALPQAIGDVCAAVHRDAGVDVVCDARVEGFEGGERVSGVKLEGGRVVPADLVVVGIGVAPETAWLEGSGLGLDNGVVCDETCLAAPGITAAGDVARWPSPRFGRSLRVEHWTNAVEMGEAAAERLLVGEGEAKPFDPVPYVWSDQYDRKIMSAGSISPDDEMHIGHGTLEERRFVALFGREGRLSGALCFNRAPQLMKYRRLMRENGSWQEALEIANG